VPLDAQKQGRKIKNGGMVGFVREKRKWGNGGEKNGDAEVLWW
jgi:hypothetical protein